MCILIIQHLGLGDFMIFNGLIRHFAETDDIILFVWERNFKEVSYMFRDLKNLRFCRLFMETSEEVDYNVNTLKYDKLLVVGTHTINGKQYNNDMVRTRIFDDEYRHAGLDPQIRYTKFFIERDQFMETHVYNLFMHLIGHRKYIVVHDDPSRNLIIDVPENDVFVFFISNTRNDFTKHFHMFHMYKIIENSEAFHGYEGTGWTGLIEQWKFPSLKKYIHVYTRRNAIKSGIKTAGVEDNFSKELYKAPNWYAINETGTPPEKIS